MCCEEGMMMKVRVKIESVAPLEYVSEVQRGFAVFPNFRIK